MALFGNKSKKNFTKAASMEANPQGALLAMIEEAEEEDEEERRIRGDIFKMLDQGTGSFVDLLAPPRMKILYDNIELGDEALAVYTVSNWPDALSYGWLNHLLDDSSLTDIKMDVSMHIHPVRKQYAIAFMEDKYNAAKSSAEAEYEQGKVKENNQRVYSKQMENAQMVRSLLEAPNENLFQVSLIIGIYGQTQFAIDPETGEEIVEKSAHEDLVEKTNRFRKVLANNSHGGFGIKSLLHQQRDGIKSLLPWGYGGLHSFQNFYTSALATCYPFTQGTLQVESGILHGTSLASGQPIFFDIFNRQWMKSFNTVVIGTSGSGKSATVKTLLGRYALRGTQIFVIDPAIVGEGEYTNLCTSLEGSIIDFGGRDSVYLNPFELTHPAYWKPSDYIDDEEAERIYKQKKSYLSGLIDIMRKDYEKENGGEHQINVFSQVLSTLIDRLYQYKGLHIKSKEWNYAEWDSPDYTPTLKDFYEILVEYEKIIKDYRDRNQLVAWGKHNLAPDGSIIVKTSKSLRIVFGYYRYIMHGRNHHMWGQEEYDAVHLLRNIIQEYITDPRSEIISDKAMLFSGRRAADLTNQCVVFRFGHTPANLKGLAVYMAFELINSRITASSQDGYKNKLVVLDEAWKLINTPSSNAYMQKLFREGRKTNTGTWLISQSYYDFQGPNAIFFNEADQKIIMALPDDQVSQLMDDIDLSPSLADIINADRGHNQKGCGILHLGGVRKETMSFYCDLSELEMMIADTSDSTHPPMTVEDMIGYENAKALGYI